MSDRTPSPIEEHPFQLMIVDEDPVFRLGLRIWLNRYPDLQVVAEAETGSAALQWLASEFRVATPDSPSNLNLVILELSLGRSDSTQLQGLDLCQTIASQYPYVSVLVLSKATEPLLLAAAQQAGARGYCPRNAAVEDLTQVVRQVAAGQPCWIQPTAAANSPRSSRNRAIPILTEEQAVSRDRPSASGLQPPNSFTILRRNLRLSGLRQIDAAIQDVREQLQNLDLSDLDRAILAGRYRELRASRWLVSRLLATPSLPATEESEPQGNVPPDTAPNQSLSDASGTIQPVTPVTMTIANGATGSVVSAQSVQSVLFDTALAKLQTSLSNQTEIPLEIDILREDKKRELFYLILRKLEDLLNELRFSQVEPDQLDEKRSLILQDLWEATAIEFFGKYYTVPLGSLQVEVVNTILQDANVVRVAILDRIPFVIDLFKHLLFQLPLAVEQNAYPVGNPEALDRAELILDNLMIQVGNGVIQPLLNHFANVETIKQNLYDRRLLSSREIERFRNSLSWKYRVQQLIAEPQDIFESQYSLFTLVGRGIKRRKVYAPRQQELSQLSGLQLAVTVALEARDAIAPRLRSAVSLVGNSVIYVLTEVIGRGIGLVGRGIIKGIGNAWQDNRYSRK
jgi:DNA-binding NarL/FixJ family response regulator